MRLRLAGTDSPHPQNRLIQRQCPYPLPGGEQGETNQLLLELAPPKRMQEILELLKRWEHVWRVGWPFNSSAVAPRRERLAIGYPWTQVHGYSHAVALRLPETEMRPSAAAGQFRGAMAR